MKYSSYYKHKSIGVLILLLLRLKIIFGWTIYKREFNENMTNYIKNVPEECKVYYQKNLSAVSYSVDNKYGLWPNLVSSHQLKHGQILFGFEEAIDAIWKRQHPSDCTSAKFAFATDWDWGFASRIHVEGSGLTYALDRGYIYIPPKVSHPSWYTNTSICKIKNTTNIHECYYLPWSNCTVPENLEKKVPTLPFTQYEIPNMFMPMLKCSPIQEKFYYYWWRAITASYLIRPNKLTLDELKKYHTLPIATKESVHHKKRCVAVYVRHGDKGSEMKLVSMETYKAAIEYMWANGLVQNKHKSNMKNLQIFFGTETPKIFTAAINWARESNFSLYYTNLFDREYVINREGHFLKHHGDEYLSMLLNLEYSLKCDAWVCTLASNWCRVIDELRATIGSKANYHYADLSNETCSKTPCIDGIGNYNFYWR